MTTRNSVLFCKKLGIKYPIIQAPMAGIATADMAAEVTNSGGLGSLPLATFDLRKGIEGIVSNFNQYQSLLDRPSGTVNLNFFCHDIFSGPSNSQVNNLSNLYSSVLPSVSAGTISDAAGLSQQNGNVSFKEIETNHPEIIDALFDYWAANKDKIPKIVSFHFGIPSQSTIQKLHDQGTLVFVTATSLKEAQLIIDSHADGVVCQGYQAGGHRGHFLDSDESDTRLDTETLVAEILKHVEAGGTPTFVIAAGGIMTAEDITKYLFKGVSAVQLGTAFLAVPQSNSEEFIAGILKSKKSLPPTAMTAKVSGKSARAIVTPFIQGLMDSNIENSNLPPYGFLYNGYKKLKASLKSNQTDVNFYLAGENYPKITLDSTAGAIVKSLGSRVTEN